MQIDQQLIDEMLAVYFPDYRCLKSANYEYPNIEGVFELFKIPPYTQVHIDYLTIFATQLATIQLGCVFFAQAIKEGRLPDLTFDDFKTLQEDLKLLIHKFDVKFRRKVDTTKKITGRLHLDELRFDENKNNYKANLSYDFENSSTLGSIEAVVLIE